MKVGDWVRVGDDRVEFGPGRIVEGPIEYASWFSTDYTPQRAWRVRLGTEGYGPVELVLEAGLTLDNYEGKHR